METRANYALIGLFTVAVIAAGFGFVYWFHRGGGVGERVPFQVVFDNPVTGLRTGAAVVFNGIRVGEVSDLTLNIANPRQVIATIVVSKSAPVRSDTKVGVEYQGLTGIAALSLRGGAANAPALESTPDRPVVLQAELSTAPDVMQAGRDVLRRLEEVLSENQESLRNTIRNLETFTATMARNQERIDRIIAGTEKVVSGADSFMNGKDGKGGDLRQAVQAVTKFVDNLDQHTTETIQSYKVLADNLDKRTAEIAVGLNRFSNQGLRKWELLADDARRAVGEFERAVRNFDRNPSRLLFGGGGGASATAAPEQPAGQPSGETPRRRRR
jgi:phospholipid/cholesterol/gamma-HCH transport system substrate-binding protein